MNGGILRSHRFVHVTIVLATANYIWALVFHSNNYCSFDPCNVYTSGGVYHDFMLADFSIFRNESSVLADNAEPNDCHQYGDLEVFLLGLRLECIMPLFKKHHIDFAMLLSMADNDLKQVGDRLHMCMYTFLLTEFCMFNLVSRLQTLSPHPK